MSYFVGRISDLVYRTLDAAARQMLNTLVKIQENVPILQPNTPLELDDSVYDKTIFRNSSRVIPIPDDLARAGPTCTFKVVSNGKQYTVSKALLMSKSEYCRAMFDKKCGWVESHMNPIPIEDECILHNGTAFVLFLKACVEGDYVHNDDLMEEIWKTRHDYTPSDEPKARRSISEDIIQAHTRVYLIADRYGSDDVQKLAIDRLFEALFKLNHSVEFIVELLWIVYSYTMDPSETSDTQDKPSAISRVMVRNMLLQSVQKRYSLSNRADKQILELSTFFFFK